jgi:hypothetical protein
VADPLLDHGNLGAALRLVAAEAEAYLAGVDDAPVRPPGSPKVEGNLLPAEGVGSLAALNELIAASLEGATRSTGPRFFHFVMGGGTPAALGGDWLASALDQVAFNWVSSPFAARLEQVSLDWVKDLFGLPRAWSGVASSRRARRWPTSSGWRPLDDGGACSMTSTSRPTGWPAFRRSPSCPAATYTRAR